ncbi:MAG: class I SAM-dependent methyltransferase [Candidatus Saccharimonas sp.]
MNKTFWQENHDDYATRDWSRKPSIFAEEVIGYFPANSYVLELGCGQAQDGLWFAGRDNGLRVHATDFEDSALQIANERNSELALDAIEFEKLDLRRAFPCTASTFDVVYSHLALHYFDKNTTERLFDEIYRVLKPGGVLAFLVNSVHDPEYDTGHKLEADYYETKGTEKRYFSAKTASEFAHKFEPMICDEKGETYKDIDKGVHNLVRFVGRKNA